MKTKSIVAGVACLFAVHALTAQTYWREGGNAVSVSSTIGNTNNSGTTDLNLVTKGTSRIRILDDGRVGIGTTSPSTPYKVDIAGSVNLNKGVTSSGDLRALFVNSNEALLFNPGTFSAPPFFSWGAGGSYNVFAKGINVGFSSGTVPPTSGLLVSGHVGIGLSNPAVDLHVSGTTDPGFMLTSTGSSASALIGVASQNSSYSANTVPGDVVFGPKGGSSHDLILSAQNANQGSIRFKSGPIGGDQELMTIRHDGNVGIGVSNPNNKLEVCGLIRAKEVIVETMWCDFVFEKDYRLRPLSEVESFITANKHLPGIPSASDVETNGIKIGQVHANLLQKVEELTLYMIDADKRIKELQAENVQIKAELDAAKNNTGK